MKTFFKYLFSILTLFLGSYLIYLNVKLYYTPEINECANNLYNNDVVKACEETGRYCIQWDVDSLDWKELTVKEIANRVLLRTKSGSIILLHNGTPNTAEALKIILPALADKGFKFAVVSDLIYKEGFTIDHTGKQKL